MKKLLCGLLLLVSALAHSTLAGAASVTLGQAGAGGVSAIITPDPGEIGQPANIWMGGVLNGTLYLRDGPSNWAEYRGGPLSVALTSAALPSSLQVSIVNVDISSLPGLDVYVGYGSAEADLSRSGHLAKVYTVPTPTNPTSYNLIDAAQTVGTITEETAIKYKVFVTFKDARLPAEFHGDDRSVTESNVIDLVYERWGSFSDATKGILEPFLVPPAYQGSWASPAAAANGASSTTPRNLVLPICRQPTIDPNWASKPAAAGGRFKVWYDTRVAGAATKADLALNELETKIWPTLIDAVGMLAPISDASINGCNGGDGRLDVYLVDMATLGQNAIDLGETFPVQFATKQHPTFLLIKQTLDDNELKGTLAHEFMHASQWAYPVAALGLSSYRWLKESTAQWAIDAVYPNLPKGTTEFAGCTTMHFEQCKAQPFMDSPDSSLETETLGNDRVYGSYLFFQFLARTLQPTVIAGIWNATLSQSDQVMAVDNGIPGGFKEQWPKFAKLLWNQDPVNTNSFEHWDSLTLTPKTRGDVIWDIKLNGQPGATATLNGNIKHLATHYYHYRVTDPNVRSLSFFNHLFAINPMAGFEVTTQAFFRKQGSIWQYEHWSDEGMKESVKSFCLDVVAERVEELVIVMSNNHPTDDITVMDESTAPRVSASNVGCWRYKGTTSVTENSTTSTDTGRSTAGATVTFERHRFPQLPDGTPGQESFQVESGAFTGRLEQTVVAGACTLTSDGIGPIPAGPSGSLAVALGVDVGIGTTNRSVSGSGSGMFQTHTEFICPETPPVVTDGLSGWSWMEFPTAVEVNPDGTIQGRFTSTISTPIVQTKELVWTLTPQRQQ